MTSSLEISTKWLDSNTTFFKVKIKFCLNFFYEILSVLLVVSTFFFFFLNKIVDVGSYHLVRDYCGKYVLTMDLPDS
jgi:hypothetical protein